MKTYREDKERYRQFRQLSSAARIFDGHAARGFVEWINERDEKVAEETKSKISFLFHQAEENLGEFRTMLDEALSERDAAEIENRSAGREQEAAFVALRGPVCSALRLADSLGRSRKMLGLEGDTPRRFEELAAWGRVLSITLPRANVSEAARPLLVARAKLISPLADTLEAAVERKVVAQAGVRTTNIRLRAVRKKVDKELGKVKRWLQTSLDMVGHEELARKVLGPRRGRPPKSLRPRKESHVETTRAEEAGPKSDVAPTEIGEARQKSGFVPTRTEEAGQKFDSEPESTVLRARSELQETEEAPSKASTALQEIVEGPSKAGAADQKIAEGPCKPCTELSENGGGVSQAEEVASFQEDTSRSVRRRRRRGASALLGAPGRWFSSGWMGRFVSRDRSRRKGGAGGGVG